MTRKRYTVAYDTVHKIREDMLSAPAFKLVGILPMFVKVFNSGTIGSNIKTSLGTFVSQGHFKNVPAYIP
jgi:hypothetical protein